MRQWLLHRTHLSWTIASWSAGVVIGVALCLGLPPRPAPFGVVLVALAGGLIAVRWRFRWVVLVAGVAGLALGAWRGTAEQTALQQYQPLYGQVVQATGVLRDDVAMGPKGDQRFELHTVRVEGRLLTGRVWVSAASKTDSKRGDTIIVRGKLGEGFGTMAATMYRATVVKIQRPHPGDVARQFRDWFAAGVRTAIPEPAASLGIGYLTGQRSTLPVELDEQLRIVGLTHAVVASGYNLTILVSFARNCLAALSKYLATLAAAIMIVGFILITGLSPSMTRAGLVAGLGLLAWYYGRAIHPVVLLLTAMAITVLVRPSFAWGDLGWCLSFGAFAGVIIVGPLLERYLWGKAEKPPFVLKLVLETLAAEAVTLPIILYAFGQYPAYALAANVLVLPLVPLAMASTFVAGVVAVAWPTAAAVAGWPATMLLKYMLGVIERIAELPGAQKDVHFGIAWLIASYIILSVLTVYLWRVTRYDFREPTSRKNV